MSRTRIPWADYSINPIKGVCLKGCAYCYAIRQYKRFKWNPQIRLDLSVFDECKHMKPGSKVFLCSTHDLFGGWIPMVWRDAVLELCSEYPQLTFIVLTKEPRTAHRHKYPDNVWLGVTVEDQNKIWRITELLCTDIGARVKFVSFEPLHGLIDCHFNLLGQKIDWYIIGAETGNRKGKITPRAEWINHLLAQHADTPVFLKENIIPYWGEIRPEFQAFPGGFV